MWTMQKTQEHLQQIDTKPAQMFFFIVAQVMAFLTGLLSMKLAYGHDGMLVVCMVGVLWIMAMYGWSRHMRMMS